MMRPLEVRLRGPQSLSGRGGEGAMVDTEIGYEDVSCFDLSQDVNTVMNVLFS
jgi:hypothetical protein